ncbi:hypothetical protein AYR66_23165 [Noviherbaspirillum denitrificans]|uniref:Peptidase metallopeptidase domain-containing protein n=1 Tax=Noviherbaspirillum denitrificans TaxID=1968433 RepID=A0A254TQE8_9BURK|nr:hypothetical protein AYR66_23165 [Noviherbaspirillum denitrificans]
MIGKPISGDYRIDALLESADYRWNAGSPLGTAVEVTYSFMSEKPSYGGTDSDGSTGFQTFSNAQRAAVRDIFAQLATMLNISFREVADVGSNYGQIRFGNNMQPDSSGYAFLPNSDSSDISGDVWISLDYSTEQTPGSFSYSTLLHEIGHALGLKHPGNYNAGEAPVQDANATYLGQAEDIQQYTLMSYRDASYSEGQQRTWYGLYDMLALQYLYGAKSVNTGDANTYSYNDASGRNLTLIQDSAGTQDTIDLSAVTIGAHVDLRGGGFSSVGKGQSGHLAIDNLTIMAGTMIENLVATAGNDTITGNAASNRITSGGGSDTIDGGGGTDTVILQGNRGAWKLAVSGATVTANRTDNSATSALSNVERIQFNDMNVNLQAGDAAKSVTAAQLKSIEELYVAYFNRIPDADGLSYWAGQLKGGQTITQVGESFYSAAVQYATLTGYSSDMGNADFVRVIYKNVLGRSGTNAPPDADINYWANEIAQGRETRGSLISTMLNSAHSFKGDTTWGWVADLLDNKVAVANYFAVDNGLNYNTAEDSISKGMAIAAAISATDTGAAIQLIGLPA